MARYRKVEVKTWSDGKFRELSPIPPCGQGLWLWFLTGTRTTNIPGVVIGTESVMAAELRWPLEAFREAFREASDKGMAKGNLEAGVVWLPNATRPGDKRNKPESPNVIKSWRDTWDEIPECSLKLEIWQQLKAFAEAFGKGFAEAYGEACRKPSSKALPNQEQEQKQEQKCERGAPSAQATHADENRPGDGSRLPNDWQPDADFARSEIPDIDVDREADKFRDWYRAQAGTKGVKLDWTATWRTWIRNAKDRDQYTRREPARSTDLPFLREDVLDVVARQEGRVRGS